MEKKILNPKRILLKLSWEALQWKYEYWIDVDFMNSIAQKVVNLSKDKWIEIIIVIWWWNIFRWVSGAAKWLDRASADYMWMMATIMNGIALWDAIEKYDQPVRIMSAIDIPRVAETFIRRRAIKHLERKRVLICVAGTGNPYFTTDSAAVLRALELNCDIMVKGTKVDGIYDKDPMKHVDAVKFDNLYIDDALNKGFRIMDQSAIALAKDEKLPLFVCKMTDIDKIWDEDIVWTYVYVDER